MTERRRDATESTDLRALVRYPAYQHCDDPTGCCSCNPELHAEYLQEEHRLTPDEAADEIELTGVPGHLRCQECGNLDIGLLMIHEDLRGLDAEDPKLILCPACINSRLVALRGHGITSDDLTDCPLNHDWWPDLMDWQRNR